MNELQQVLLVFAIVVVAGLYFLSRSRQAAVKKSEKESRPPSPGQSSIKQDDVAQDENLESASYKKASHALNDLGEPHIPVSKSTEDRFSKVEPPAQEIDENQGVLSFGAEFDLPKEPASKSEPTETASDEVIDTVVEPEVTEKMNDHGGKHHVLEVEDLAYTAPSNESASFGIPKEGAEKPADEDLIAGARKEPQVFVLMVMSAGHEFSMTDLNKALLGVGLSFSDSGIYVKRDNMGNSIIRVANLLEPGAFPAEAFEDYKTPGVAMILELPSTVRAPAAMHDLIMMARKVSQRLQGRLYNMERQLIKESDLQTMRDAAVEYESEPL